MGQSIFQSTVKGTEGKVLFESFESPTFAADQGWVTQQGIPVQSSDVAFDGVFSFEVDSSFPRISKALSTAVYPRFYVVFYFYDDASNVTGEDAYGYIVDNAAAEFGVGVDNAISTGFYVLKNGSITAVPRTSGWHRVVVRRSGGDWETFIDGAVVQMQIGAVQAFFRLGTTAAAGVSPFLYFDAVQISTDYKVLLYQVPAGYWASFYKADGTQIGVQQQSSGTFGVSLDFDTLAINSPFDGYFRIVDPNRSRQWFQSPTESFFGGDSFGVLTVGFGRRASDFSLSSRTERQSKRATSGKTESIFYYADQKVTVSFAGLTDDQKNTMEAFFRNVQNEKRFSFAMDEEGVFFAPLLSASTPFSTKVLPVASGYTGGLRAGSKLVIYSEDGEKAQVVTVSTATVVANEVQLTEAVQFGFVAGDLVRALYSWPVVVLEDSAFTPIIENLKYKRWMLTATFREELP